MAYTFEPGDISPAALRRIANQQLDRLGVRLGEPADIAAGHHEARKCLKRLRALLMLARPVLGCALWREADRQLRDIGRCLSGARDAEVLPQIFDRLTRDYGEAAYDSARLRLRKALAKRQIADAITPGKLQLSERIDHFREQLMELPLDRFGTEISFASLAQDYRSGRAGVAKALASQDAEDLHDLRKHVQRHWRHMQVLSAGWPEEMRARLELAKALSERLGEDHDLWLLHCRLRDGAAGRQDAKWVNEIGGLCQDRQLTLRAEVARLASQLYAERPKHLRRRLAAYWAAQEATGVVAADDVVPGQERVPVGR